MFVDFTYYGHFNGRKKDVTKNPVKLKFDVRELNLKFEELPYMNVTYLRDSL